MKVLYTISDSIKHPAVGGPFLRVENSIKALNSICELHLLVRSSRERLGGKQAETFYKGICRKFVYTPTANNSTNSFFYKVKRFFLKNVNSDADFIVEYARKNGISVVWFGYGNVSYALMKEIKEKAPELKLVCDTDSVWSRFVLRGLPFASSEQEKLRIEEEGHRKEKEEREWVNFCDVTTAVSEVDADYYMSLAHDTSRIKLFSNVLDINNYNEKVKPPLDFKTLNIYLAGSFFCTGSPMDMAARWMIDDVLPLVRRELPDIHFYIIGNGSKKILSDIQDPNITIAGCVDSVLPYLCNASVAVVPLTFESGTRFKILEAAACGIPVVSTTLGAEGIPVKNGENILIADDALNFAEAIVKLIRDPSLASSIANNLRDYVRQNYSIEKHANEALNILYYLK